MIRVLLALFLLATPALAQPATVLVVYDSQSPDSKRVADYYLAKRAIPAANLCAIATVGVTPTNPGVRIDLAQYTATVKTPVLACLAGKPAVTTIVLTYGTPFVVDDHALDSTLAGLTKGFNGYYASDGSYALQYTDFVPLATWRLTHPTEAYSVWRLDGATAEVAMALVDKAMRAEAAGGPKGQGCFDARGPSPTDDGSYGDGDVDVLRAAQFVAAAGYPITVDTQGSEFGGGLSPRCDNTAFYGGWYAYGHYNDAFTWNDGAIGWHLDSLSMLSPRQSGTWSGSALAKGITVTTGVVSEPYLQGIPHLDTFFRAINQGATVGDAMLRATPMINWMSVNVGDPLYRPFATPRSTTITAAFPRDTADSQPTTVTGQFLGATGEDFVGWSAGADGVPDWHLRLTGVRKAPTVISLSAPPNGAWGTVNNAFIKSVYTATTGTVDLFYAPSGAPAVFNLRMAYGDGTVDVVPGIAAVVGAVTPPVVPPGPPPPVTTQALPVGQFLGATGEDFVGGGQDVPDGVPDWHLRLTGVRSTPVAVAIAQPANSGAWARPYTGNWMVRPVFTAGTLDLFYSVYGTPVSFDVTLTYADGTKDVVKGIPAAGGAVVPPVVVPPPSGPSGNAAVLAQIQALLTQLAALLATVK